MHLVHVTKAPQYLADSVATVARTGAWRGLRSEDTAIYVKSRTITKFGELGFRLAGPDARNSLPSHLH